MPRGRKIAKSPIPTTSKRPLQPTLHLLERFSASDLVTWKRRSAELERLHQLLFYGLEPERIARRDEILAALNSRIASPTEFESWYRVVEYRWSDQPLSSAGSVLGPGGRFNIGNGCDAYIKGRGFPALYIGDSSETAFREFYQCESRDLEGTGLTRAEMALRKSDTTVRLRGRIERVFDATDISALKPVAAVFAKFAVPRELEDLAKSLKLGPARDLLIRTPAKLREHLQDHNWRAWPIQFGLPAPCQRFGEFLLLAGFEGVKYASAKNPGQSCIAVFPGNIASNRTFVELTDTGPSSLDFRKLDLDSVPHLAGFEHLDLGAGPSSVN